MNYIERRRSRESMAACLTDWRSGWGMLGGKKQSSKVIVKVEMESRRRREIDRGNILEWLLGHRWCAIRLKESITTKHYTQTTQWARGESATLDRGQSGNLKYWEALCTPVYRSHSRRFTLQCAANGGDKLSKRKCSKSAVIFWVDSAKL